MKIVFEFDFVRVGSWDGKWSGEGKVFARVLDLSSAEAEKIVADDSLVVFLYDFGDGWTGRVRAHAEDDVRAALYETQSEGFCGYDWMIASIMSKGKIEKGGARG